MPRYERYTQLAGQIRGSIARGEVSATWIEGGKAFLYSQGGKRLRFNVARRKAEETDVEAPSSPPRPAPHPNDRRRRPQRGRQFSESFSPDGKARVFYRAGNLWWSAADGSGEKQLTREGDEAKRIKFGTGSWVYGEELNQVEAMGWSADNRTVWCYRFDESKVPDYYLTLDLAKVQNRLYVEAYPKAGAPNPEVDLYAIDTASGRATPIEVREGRPFDEDLGHYVYGIRFSHDDKELWFHRTNRWQNVMEWCAADPSTGKVRVVVREEWQPSWVENSPPRIFLDEDPDIAKATKYRGHAIWMSERSGYRNAYLLDLKSGTFSPITKNSFELERVVRVDLARGEMFYTAWSGDNPYKRQLHAVRLDGTRERRITDPKLHHAVNIAPDGKSFIDVAETLSTPPTTRVLDADGKVVATLATSDLSKFDELGLKRVERIEYLANDGKTKLYGELHKPSDFDETRKYPVLVSVYAGPESGGMGERFETPDPLTELGFLVASFASRGTTNRGKAFKDAVYMKLGVVEIDDQAFGVRALAARPYVDPAKVGIHGTSYGGYAAAMALLRFPDVFAAAAASSSVTDWRNYDTIYTERYMRTPQANPEGYAAGSCMTYAKDLKGRLLLYYGTADDNVHPTNTYQLVNALQRAGKSFELQTGPDQGHSGLDFRRTLEFFVERLVTNP